jgi:hypothetical protein
MVPNTVGQTSVYNLRTASNTRNIPYQTPLYSKSVLLPLIKDWNDLRVEQRNSQSLEIFKKRLNEDVKNVPVHYYLGKITYITYTFKNTLQLYERTSVFTKYDRKPFLYM